jgi:hypothetical protein
VIRGERILSNEQRQPGQQQDDRGSSLGDAKNDPKLCWR